MRLLVVTYKRCRRDSASPSGYATDGGFPIQMRALSELFGGTTLLMEDGGGNAEEGDVPLHGHHLKVHPIARPVEPFGRRKIGVIIWSIWQLPRLIREIHAHDAVHTPIPCDTGTVAMLLAWFLGKPLYVRHCGNWFATRTIAERFWKWFMTRAAGGHNVMLATGGSEQPPDPRYPEVRWIFSTTLDNEEMKTASSHERRFPDGEVRLALVGRQEAGKGTDIAIRALAQLRIEGLDARLHVAGDGGALESFRRLADEIGVRDAVVFYGRVDHDGVMDLLRRAHLFCLPTESEGFPKAVLEAQAAGLPVITTRVSVLPLLVEPDAGVLLDERSPDAVCKAVRLCLASEGEYRDMSAAARRSAARYSIEAWKRALEAHFTAAWRH